MKLEPSNLLKLQLTWLVNLSASLSLIQRLVFPHCAAILDFDYSAMLLYIRSTLTLDLGNSQHSVKHASRA